MSWRDYLKWNQPTIWCAGCGYGIILRSMAQALSRLEIPKERAVVVTGIGCFGKADDYVETHALHGTHGRALAFATGVKLANPDLTVIALMGDGDCATIGGNHFIHAARRNVDITAVIANNYNYGMTGGQYSATTPPGKRTSTSPLGNAEGDFDLCQLAAVAGANYVAATSVFHVLQLERLIAEAIQKKGFSVVEVHSPCPTYYGRNNGALSAVEMMQWLCDSAVSVNSLEEARDVRANKHIAIGKLLEKDRPDYLTRYREINGGSV